MDKILNSFLTPIVVLDILREKPLHGYGIRSAIRKKYRAVPSFSILYSTLHLMEKETLVKSTWDNSHAKARKVYTVTEKGIEKLRESTSELKILVLPLFLHV